MKLRIYIDTSVIGGNFDKEFDQSTKEFFKLASENDALFLISDLLAFEVSTAPEFVKDFF